jgi:hypothetical protein
MLDLEERVKLFLSELFYNRKTFISALETFKQTKLFIELYSDKKLEWREEIIYYQNAPIPYAFIKYGYAFKDGDKYKYILVGEKIIV